MILILATFLTVQIVDLQKYIGREYETIHEMSRYCNCFYQWGGGDILLSIVKGRRCNASFQLSDSGRIVAIKTFGAGCPGDEKTLEKISVEKLLQMALRKKLSQREFALIVGPPNMSVGWGDFGSEGSSYKLDECPRAGADPQKVIEQVNNSPCGFEIYFKRDTIQKVYPPRGDNCWFEYYPGELDILKGSDSP